MGRPYAEWRSTVGGIAKEIEASAIATFERTARARDLDSATMSFAGAITDGGDGDGGGIVLMKLATSFASQSCYVNQRSRTATDDSEGHTERENVTPESLAARV